jgi:hypothetical protein
MQHTDELNYTGLPKGTYFTEEEKQERIKNADALYNLMKPIAEKLGYVLFIHGSKVRDIDLVAVPWYPDSQPPEKLVKKLCQNFNMIVAKQEQRPHNRYSYGMFKKGWRDHVIDLSVFYKYPPDQDQ